MLFPTLFPYSTTLQHQQGIFGDPARTQVPIFARDHNQKVFPEIFNLSGFPDGPVAKPVPNLFKK
ncbi:MAG TPA: hypothetical protein VGD31_15960 [Sphingobacteriaceae bacterium]